MNRFSTGSDKYHGCTWMIDDGAFGTAGQRQNPA